VFGLWREDVGGGQLSFFSRLRLKRSKDKRELIA
jgi:hypothetical protein